MEEKRFPPVVNQRRQEKSGPARAATASSFPEDTNTEKELSSVGWGGRAGGGGAKPDTSLGHRAPGSQLDSQGAWGVEWSGTAWIRKNYSVLLSVPGGQKCPVSFYTQWILRQLFGVDFSVEAVALNELVCEVHALLRTQGEEAETLGPALPLSMLWLLQGAVSVLGWSREQASKAVDATLDHAGD